MDWRELEHLKGHPVRLGPAGSPTPVLHGILSRVDCNGITVELLDSIPSHLGGRFRVEVLDAEAMVRFFTTGATDWIHQWKIHLDSPDQIDTVQRRQFPRVQVILPLWVHALEGDVSPERLQSLPAPTEHPHGYTRDLSSGGMAIVTDQLLTAGHKVIISLDLGRGSYLVGVIGLVTRCGPGPSGTWFAAVRFMDASLEMQVAVNQLVLANLQAAPSSNSFGKVVKK